MPHCIIKTRYASLLKKKKKKRPPDLEKFGWMDAKQAIFVIWPYEAFGKSFAIFGNFWKTSMFHDFF